MESFRTLPHFVSALVMSYFTGTAHVRPGEFIPPAGGVRRAVSRFSTASWINCFGVSCAVVQETRSFFIFCLRLLGAFMERLPAQLM